MMYDSIWKKRFWVPVWVIQAASTIALIVLDGITLQWVRDDEEYYSNDGYSPDVTAAHYLYGAFGVYMSLCTITLLFNIAEIILFARHKLSPVTAVVLATLTTAIWTIVVILLLIGIFGSGRANIIVLIFEVLLFLSSVFKLVYSAIHVHRWRKARAGSRGAYKAANVEAGFDSYTGYNSTTAQSATQADPFRDASRGQSPVPALHPSGGAAAGYYDPPRPAALPFEMQHTLYSGEQR